MMPPTFDGSEGDEPENLHLTEVRRDVMVILHVQGDIFFPKTFNISF